MKQFFVWLCAIAMIMLSACGQTSDPTPTPTSSATQTPNTVLVTPDATRQSLNLPPTWTPTYTPTITHTPTVTPTFTVTPLPTPIDIELLCDNFRYNDNSVDGETFSAGESFPITYGIDIEYDYAFVGVMLEHDDLEKPILTTAPGGTDYRSTFVVEDFPVAGDWQYSVGVFLRDGDGILCEQSGTFTIEASAIPTAGAVTIPTAFAVPSITPQPDPTEGPLCYLICPN